MPADILSLDLDWFNFLPPEERREGIEDFFAFIKEKCVLPEVIDWVPEHQYLYPWSLRVMKRVSCRKVRVVNVDEHHDFYYLHEEKLGDHQSIVGCWNFFGHMAYKGLMSDYIWVTNDRTKTGARGSRRDLMSELVGTGISSKFRRKIQVTHIDGLTNAIKNRKFDGFLIVQSPEYTKNYRSVYHNTELALESVLPEVRIRRYKCRENFRNGRVHHRANALFWEV